MQGCKKKHPYWKLFISTFWLSASTFGGGSVIVPLMKKRFVDDLGWIDEQEMLNYICISQSSPGAVAVNASILLGYHMAGFWGALVTIAGTVLPPLLILSIVSAAYAAFRDNVVVNAVLKGMQAGIAAVIIDLVIHLGSNVVREKRLLPALIMLGSFAALYIFNINIMMIIAACILLGLGTSFITMKKNLGKLTK